MTLVKITKLKGNPSNPRVLRDDKFAKLKASIEAFPDMLQKRPIVAVTDKDGKLMVLGGNMRLKACADLGMKEVPVILADEWTEEQRREFIIKDNVGFGEWDWDALGNEWKAEDLNSWGLDVPSFATQPDYSILDDEDVQGQLDEMRDGVKKAIQIEFEAEHYEEAYQLVKHFRDAGGYVGGMIMEFLKAEKAKG
jgi:hypothetical protein